MLFAMNGLNFKCLWMVKPSMQAHMVLVPIVTTRVVVPVVFRKDLTALGFSFVRCLLLLALGFV